MATTNFMAARKIVLPATIPGQEGYHHSNPEMHLYPDESFSITVDRGMCWIEDTSRGVRREITFKAAGELILNHDAVIVNMVGRI